MKLSDIFETGPKDDAAEKKKAGKATDLGSHAQSVVWNTKGLEPKRAAALVMAKHMTAGKQADYKSRITAADSEAKIDKLVSNTMMSGEGKKVIQ
jgi:hypothetical protein